MRRQLRQRLAEQPLHTEIRQVDTRRRARYNARGQARIDLDNIWRFIVGIIEKIKAEIAVELKRAHDLRADFLDCRIVVHDKRHHVARDDR